MRIVAASDLHGRLPDPADVPHGDVLALAGDLCPEGTAARQLEWLATSFGPWLEQLPVTHVVATWGNHDWVGVTTPTPEISRVHWLVDAAFELDGCRFWGSPWSLPFFRWAFMRPEEELAETWARIPGNTNVVIVHGPPKDCGDRTNLGQRVGSVTLRQRLEQVRPQLALFGHIHEAAGQWDVAGGMWANVSIVNFRCKLVRGPQVFTLAPGPLAAP